MALEEADERVAALREFNAVAAELFGAVQGGIGIGEQAFRSRFEVRFIPR
jgi:hypothetical protein